MASYSPEGQITDAKAAIKDLVLHMQHNLRDIKVNEVVKAGSLGHGTAVPGNFDIDLVLYTQSITKEEVRDRGYDRLLKILEDFLRTVNVEKLKRTAYAVQFTYKNISVDLLVSPVWANQVDLYNFLRSQVAHATRYRFSVNASKWQVDFLSHQPNKVKDLIKRAKAWRNEKWPSSTKGTGRPKSYMIAIMVLEAYERACDRGVDQKRIEKQTTTELKQMVKNHSRLDVYWEEYYKRRDYPTVLPSRPRIIDPANPTNNLYETGITAYYEAHDRSHDYEPGNGNWTAFVQKIDTIDLTRAVEDF